MKSLGFLKEATGPITLILLANEEYGALILISVFILLGGMNPSVPTFAVEIAFYSS